MMGKIEQEVPVSIYGHAGSQNHGNEAIVRGLASVFGDRRITVYSFSPEEDREFGLHEVCEILPSGRAIRRLSMENLPYALLRRFLRRRIENHRPRFENLLRDVRGIYLLEAGDQYCEPQIVRSFYSFANRAIHARGGKTVACGCTIRPDLLKRPGVMSDLNRYDLVIARESLTYEALQNAGLQATLLLAPCPAFAMEARECPLPPHFSRGDVIGLNAGPLAQGNEAYYELLVLNYERLIERILATTDASVALIPHVNWRGRMRMRDTRTLVPLFLRFKDTGRVVLIKEQDAVSQKYVMSRCRFMVALRTHVSIPSLASCVPTLITGYKTKSTGIARDVFGASENYVAPVQSLTKEDDIWNAFQWLQDHETPVRKHLQRTMPGYIAGVYEIRDAVMALS